MAFGLGGVWRGGAGAPPAPPPPAPPTPRPPARPGAAPAGAPATRRAAARRRGGGGAGGGTAPPRAASRAPPRATRQLIDLYGADPWRVETVTPGVDLSVFRPAGRFSSRRRLGLPADAVVLAFAGRIQPLKGPDVVLRAAASLLRLRPLLADRLVVVIVGGPSGSEVGAPGRLEALASSLGISSCVRFEAPCPPAELADWCRAADVGLVPS